MVGDGTVPGKWNGLSGTHLDDPGIITWNIQKKYTVIP